MQKVPQQIRVVPNILNEINRVLSVLEEKGTCPERSPDDVQIYVCNDNATFSLRWRRYGVQKEEPFVLILRGVYKWTHFLEKPHFIAVTVIDDENKVVHWVMNTRLDADPESLSDDQILEAFREWKKRANARST